MSWVRFILIKLSGIITHESTSTYFQWGPSFLAPLTSNYIVLLSVKYYNRNVRNCHGPDWAIKPMVPLDYPSLKVNTSLFLKWPFGHLLLTKYNTETLSFKQSK